MNKDYIDYVDINDIVRNIKNKNKILPPKDLKDLLESKMSKGVLFKNILFDIILLDFDNPFTEKEARWYYFKCPLCGDRVRKIYSVNDSKIACRKCCKIRNKFKVNTHADRVFRIQTHLGELFSGKKISSKKKSLLIQHIVDHYNKLDEKYRFAYNTYIFTEIQNWCLDRISDESKSKDYKEAVYDMLDILKNTRKILVKSGLANPKNKKLKI